MKKILGLVFMFSSLSVFADIHCSGDGILIDIYENEKRLVVSGKFQGTIDNLRIDDEKYSGNASSGSFRNLTIDTDEEELDITDGDGRQLDTIKVRCN